jgi:predicted nucleic acid-binding protein
MSKPTTPVPRSYWDACVFLSYINGDADRLPEIENLLEAARQGAIEIVTSMVSIVEVARGAQEQVGKLDDDAMAKIETLWEPPSPIKLVEFHRLIAAEARHLIRNGIIRGWSLKPMDAIHLATAANIGADELVTFDTALEKYAELISVPIVRPLSGSPRIITAAVANTVT